MDKQDNNKKKKILMVCPEFPPVISPAAIRMWGFCKGLEGHGFQPVVLAQVYSKKRMVAEWVEIPSSHWVGRLSEHYVDSASKSTSSKVPKKENTRFQALLNILIPMEPAVTLSLWHLVRKVKELHKTHNFSLVFVTSNPVANAIGGVLIKKNTGCPLVVELRDPWTQNPLKTWPTRVHYLIEGWLEKKLLLNASQIIMNTPTARNNLLKKYPDRKANVVHVISHGYDSERFHEFEEENTNEPGDSLVIGYIGGFYMEPEKDNNKQVVKTILSSIKSYFQFSIMTKKQRKSSESSPEAIFKAIEELSKENSELSKNIQFRFTGASPYQIFPLAKKYGISHQVELFQKILPSKVNNEFQKCDILFLTNPRIENSPFIGAKTVEYLASGKPVLAELPQGDQARLLTKSGGGWYCKSGDVECLKEKLIEAFHAKKKRSLKKIKNAEYIKKFERKNQVNDLAKVFNQSLNKTSSSAVISEVYL